MRMDDLRIWQGFVQLERLNSSFLRKFFWDLWSAAYFENSSDSSSINGLYKFENKSYRTVKNISKPCIWMHELYQYDFPASRTQPDDTDVALEKRHDLEIPSYFEVMLWQDSPVRSSGLGLVRRLWHDTRTNRRRKLRSFQSFSFQILFLIREAGMSAR
jgi:hypothetical protein